MSAVIVHQGWAGAPIELATFTFHDAVVDLLNKVCGGHDISPLLVQDLPDIYSSTRCGRSSPEVFFSGVLESSNKKLESRAH